MAAGVSATEPDPLAFGLIASLINLRNNTGMSRSVKPLPDDDEAWVKISVDVRAGDLRWIDQHVARTDNGHGSRTDVIRAALTYYAQQHGMPERDATPAPKTQPAAKRAFGRPAKARTAKAAKPGG